MRRRKANYSQGTRERRPPQKAADVVAQLMARRGYGKLQTAAVTKEAWSKAAGGKLALQSRPGELKRGKLEVLARNSAVLQELTFLKKKILKKLLAELPDAKISGLKFRIGTVD